MDLILAGDSNPQAQIIRLLNREDERVRFAEICGGQVKNLLAFLRKYNRNRLTGEFQEAAGRLSLTGRAIWMIRSRRSNSSFEPHLIKSSTNSSSSSI